MLNSTSKRRAPMKQLRDAAQSAVQMLTKKKIIDERNVLAEMSKDAAAPILPGVPTYLPHRWTLQWAQISMHAILSKWVTKTNKDPVKQENAAEFFKYVVSMMGEQERKAKIEVNKMKKASLEMKDAKPLYDIFAPQRKYETTKAMHKFFVDSFAISVIVHANGSTGEYADWFLNDWTPALYKLWYRESKKTDGKSTS